MQIDHTIEIMFFSWCKKLEWDIKLNHKLDCNFILIQSTYSIKIFYYTTWRFIVRKVKLILGWYIFEVGKLCSQFICVLSFIKSKLPCSRVIETVCLVCLCLNENFLSAPKLKEAIIGLFPNDFSSSLCHATPSLSSWYKLSKHELNLVSLFLQFFFLDPVVLQSKVTLVWIYSNMYTNNQNHYAMLFFF